MYLNKYLGLLHSEDLKTDKAANARTTRSKDINEIGIWFFAWNSIGDGPW